MYPDYFAKREQWKKLRRESWEREVSLAYTLSFRCVQYNIYNHLRNRLNVFPGLWAFLFFNFASLLLPLHNPLLDFTL